MVNDSDQDSLASSAAYLQDGNQPMTYTPFGALIARQTNNSTKAESGKSSAGGIALGKYGKSTVKEVSTRPFDIVYCSDVLFIVFCYVILLLGTPH